MRQTSRLLQGEPTRISGRGKDTEGEYPKQKNTGKGNRAVQEKKKRKVFDEKNQELMKLGDKLY